MSFPKESKKKTKTVRVHSNVDKKFALQNAAPDPLPHYVNQVLELQAMEAIKSA